MLYFSSTGNDFVISKIFIAASIALFQTVNSLCEAIFAMSPGLQVSLSQISHVKHQPLEFLLNEPDLPGLVRAAEVFQIVVAVHVDDVVLLILRVVALSLEPRIQLIVVQLLRIAPEDEHALALRVRARNHAHAADLVDGLHPQADQVVEGLDEVHHRGLGLAGGAGGDVKLVAEGVLEALDVQERGAAAAFHVQHVTEHVVLAEGGVVFEKPLLDLGAPELQVVERVLVGLEADVLEHVADALAGDGLAILPVLGIDNLLDAGHQHRIEVLAHLDQDVLPLAAVLAVQVDDRVRCRARTGEEVEDKGIVLAAGANGYDTTKKAAGLRGTKYFVRFREHPFEFLLALLVVPDFVVAPDGEWRDTLFCLREKPFQAGNAIPIGTKPDPVISDEFLYFFFRCKPTPSGWGIHHPSRWCCDGEIVLRRIGLDR